MHWALPLLLGLWATSGMFQETITPCPSLCRCIPAKSSNRSSGSLQSGIKVRCGDQSTGKVDATSKLSVLTFPANVVHLDLSGNSLLEIVKAAFKFLPYLQRLDLKNNAIRYLAQDAFFGLGNLKRLDLSGNKLQSISGSVFLGLEKLVNLKLNNNDLHSITEGTFDDLISLKSLDLSSNPLICNCHLSWLVNWIRNESVDITPGSVCDSPPYLQGQELAKVSGLVCTPPAQVSLEILPDTDQLVFQGDSFHMACLLVGPTRETLVSWTWQDKAVSEWVPKSRFQHVDATTVSTLIIPKLELRHSGSWRCFSGNLSQSLTITVLSPNTKLCPDAVTEDLRGRFSWQPTLSGSVAQVPCHSIAGARATRPCHESGRWGPWDSTQCPYLSNITRGMQQFALMSPANPKIGSDTLLGLLKFTGNLSLLSSSRDIVYFAKTIVNHLGVLDSSTIAPLILSSMAEAMKLPRELLLQAEAEDDSCSQMLQVIESVAEQGAISLDVVAVQSFKVLRSNFGGLWCVWYLDDGGKKRLDCDFKAQNIEREFIAAIQVPQSLFEHTSLTNGHQAQLIVVVMESGALFPDNKTITSPIIGCKLVGESLETPLSTEHVWITVKSPSESMPVAWVDGHWSEAGCVVSHLLGPLMIFQCNSLGYFATRQWVEFTLPSEPPALPSRLSNAFSYAACLVLGVCLLVAMITYVASPLSMPTATRHSLANTWLAMILLSVVFSCGINLTGDFTVCHAVGMLIHYLTMSTIIWMTITVSDLHTRLTAHENISDEEEDEEGPATGPKSVLGLYFLGWGVGLIICGISAAVYRYTTPQYCFLPPSSAISAALVPALIVLLVFSFTWLLAHCAALRRAHDPLPSSYSSFASLDQERTPKSQLLALLAILLLFLAAWSTAAASVASEDWLSQVLSAFHFLICITLGTTVLFYFCAGRSDVTAEWKAFTDPRQWISPASEHCHGQAVADMEMTADQITVTDHTTVTVLEKNEVQTEEEPEDQDGLLRKINSVLSEHPRVAATVVSEDILFHDPRQLGVARKFFRRQRLRQNSDAESLFSGGSKINNTNIHHAKLNNRINVHPNMMNIELSVHKNHFESIRAQSPLSSVSEARNSKSRYLSRAHSADNLEQEKRRKHRMRRKRRRKTEEVGNESDQSKQETCV